MSIESVMLSNHLILCCPLLFFPQLFVKPPQTTTLPSRVSFSLGWFWSLPPVQCYKLPSVRKSTLNIHWKDWCWSCNTLATWCKELTHWERPWCWEDWRQKEKGATEDEMVGWHHRLNGHGFGWTPGVGDGQAGLACCNSWGRKESDTTEWLSWTEVQHNV